MAASLRVWACDCRLIPMNGVPSEGREDIAYLANLAIALVTAYADVVTTPTQRNVQSYEDLSQEAIEYGGRSVTILAGFLAGLAGRAAKIGVGTGDTSIAVVERSRIGSSPMAGRELSSTVHST